MTDRLLIVNASFLEPESATLSAGWMELAGGQIADTGTGRPPAGANTRIIDAEGATVLPGLIDAHVHLLLTSLDALDAMSWAPSYSTVRALKEAERMLHRGFTTVRDVGGADNGMARALNEGLVAGPRLIHGGRALTQTGGHGDLRPLSDDSTSCCQSRPGFARIADGADAVRKAARDEFRKGAAHLKVLLSGGVASPHDEVSAIQYSDSELAAAVEEANNHNRYVTAHAYHSRAINRALRAGVRCIEHGNLADSETLVLLAEREAFLVPTLVTYEQLAAYGKQAGMAERSYRKIAEVRDAGLATVEAAHRAGVNLVYGSDLLGPMQTAQLQEFTLRAQVQPAIDVIRAATSTAARLLRLEGQIGTLRPGAHADLILVAGNPVDDIRVLTDPQRYLRHVIKAGAVIHLKDR